MSSILNKIKETTSHKSGSQDKGSEPTFSIQPHPAKSNDPADLQRSTQPGGGLATNNSMAAHHARGPHVPSREVQNNLEKPLGREELQARAAELNK